MLKSLTLGISRTIDLITTERNASVGLGVLMRRFGICWKGLRAGLFGAMALVMSSGAWGQSVLFTFGPNVPADQQQFVRDTIASGHEFFQSRLGTTVAGTTNVFVFDDIELLVDAYMAFHNIPASRRPEIVELWTNSTAISGFVNIFIFTQGQLWNTDPSGVGLRNGRAHIILHEYAHVLEFDLVGSQLGCCPIDQVPAIGPQWLVEGAAEYLSFNLFLGDQGVIDFRFTLRGQKDAAKSVSAPLRDLETRTGLLSEDGAFILAIVAVDFAVLLKELRALVDFWQAIGDGASWQTAFESSFGLSIDDFYQEFEAFRNRGFRPAPKAMPWLLLLLLDD